MFLQLKDSYLKKQFSLEKKDELLKIYSCGPTVYNYQSIGNMRAVWLPDTIVKVAQIAGYKTRWVTNITDVGHLVDDGDDGEDKIEKGAKRDGKTVQEIVNHYSEDFVNQAKALNFNLPEGRNNPKATEYIKEQMVLTLELLIENKAYILDDGIYFSYKNSLPYLKELSNKYPLLIVLLEKIKKQQTGDSSKFTGRDVKNSTKDSSDFALWKFVPENTLQKWNLNDFTESQNLLQEVLYHKLEEKDYQKLENNWGCPGWHSECVCMIAGVFDDKFSKKCDFEKLTNPEKVISIHTGGEDHIDVHHKNEILQSFALGFNLAEHWVHNRFVMVDGGKMSKSLGNVYLVTGKESQTGFKSLKEEGFDPLAYRLMLMETKYDQRLDFTWDKLKQSQTRLYNLRKESAKILGLIEGSVQGDVEIYQKDIQESQRFVELLTLLTENLNTPKFLEQYQALLVKTAKSVQEIITKNEFISGKDDKDLFLDITVLGYFENNLLQCDLFLVPEESIFNLADSRIISKKEKDWDKSDKLRDEIISYGWQMDDLPNDKFSLWKK